ncbi:type IV pilus assembly protein FimV [Chitinilyticum piscinae]|uniref:FimV N-terminal domain-containing protein n=1 Tax=Chitinilyticum piscinae TaxID=2866724 RepID=A0A8J7FHK7_9NEIS|nr:hypothetical protein [Chitinilyticum piscinae]MBE9608340.1 hypothetical protein [Chitinilyticum piscinae]
MQRKVYPGSCKLLVAALASCGIIQASHAVSVGDLRVTSYIGQPFSGRISVDLSEGEQISDARCVKVIPDGGDLPSIGATEVSVRPGRTMTTLHLRSYAPVNEPTVAFTVQMICGQINWSRQFTVFLDPAPLVQDDRSSSPAVSLPASARKSAGTPLRRDASLAQLASRYYSPDSKAYDRYLQRLQAANPEVVDPNAPLPAGTSVVFPARPKVAAPKPAPAPAASAPDAKPTLSLSEPGKAPAATAAKPLSAEARQASYVAELERKVALMEELHGKLQNEVVQLQARLDALNASGVQQAAPASAAAAPAVLASEPAVPRRYQPDQRGMAWAGIAVAGILLGAGVGFWVWWMRRRRRNDWEDEQMGSGFAAARTAVMTQLAMRQAKANEAPAATQQSMFRHTVMIGGIEVQDDEVPLMDRATLLISQGEISEAIEVLQEAIGENPADVERWLMLFRLFRQQGMKSDYADLARRFQERKPEPDDWELVRNIGARLDPENPMYQRKTAPAPVAAPAVAAAPIEPDLAFSAAMAGAAGVAAAAPAATEVREAAEELMDFLGQNDPSPIPQAPYGHVTPPESITLDLPPLELGEPDKPEEEIAPIERLDDKQ